MNVDVSAIATQVLRVWCTNGVKSCFTNVFMVYVCPTLSDSSYVSTQTAYTFNKAEKGLTIRFSFDKFASSDTSCTTTYTLSSKTPALSTIPNPVANVTSGKYEIQITEVPKQSQYKFTMTASHTVGSPPITKVKADSILNVVECQAFKISTNPVIVVVDEYYDFSPLVAASSPCGITYSISDLTSSPSGKTLKAPVLMKNGNYRIEANDNTVTIFTFKIKATMNVMGQELVSDLIGWMTKKKFVYVPNQAPTFKTSLTSTSLTISRTIKEGVIQSTGAK